MAETPTAPVEFSGFGVGNCELTGVTMDCINWVTKDSTVAQDDGGFINWEEG